MPRNSSGCATGKALLGAWHWGVAPTRGVGIALLQLQVDVARIWQVKKESPEKLTKANLSGLDGWHKAHAVWVRTGEGYVSQCWTQQIASKSRRGRFIALPWGRDWLLPTKRLFLNRHSQSRRTGDKFQIKFFMAADALIERDVLT